MKRIGVFICHCGSNIAGTVDVEKVVEEISQWPKVAYAVDYKYLCSEPGQEMIKEAIKEHDLQRIVVGTCSPQMHETTFRQAIQEAGLNPYLLEVANLREQCSWVHKDIEKATPKAIALTRTAVEKVEHNVELFTTEVPITKKALIIGGGIAGIQAALDIAEAGHEVTIVEKEPTIGGKMAQLDKTFPTMDCSSCILTPKMVDVAAHPKINLYTYSQVEGVEGFVGNFKVKIRKKARSVIEEDCVGCGDCWEKCPQKKIPSEFERGLGNRTAIYVPFPQAVPNIPVIHREQCTYFTKDGKCGVCAKVCSRNCIDYEQEDQILEEEYGSILLATGYEVLDQKILSEYGEGEIPDVIDGLHFERLVSASGPTGGKIKRPSDGEIPKEVVFVQCAGSRDEEKGYPYCSKVCCMYTAKHAALFKEKVPDGEAYIFYMDIRSPGKGYEEFVQRGIKESGLKYFRGRVSRIFQEGDKVLVQGVDTLSSQRIEIDADLVVLATAVVPSEGVRDLGRILKIEMDSHGFLTEAHPKLRPVETLSRGIYIAGAAQGPKDIPDTVSQASNAAAKVLGLFAKDTIESDPIVASVDISKCSGCLRCHDVCAYDALGEEEITERTHTGEEQRVVCTVNESLCAGCGACTVTCCSGAIDLNCFTNQQILAEVEALCL